MENSGRVAERRAFARKKRRFLVEFNLRGAACTGFTYDVSASGIFVRSVRLPDPGTYMAADLHLPEGKRCTVRGRCPTAWNIILRLSTSFTGLPT